MSAPWWMPNDGWVRRILVPAVAFMALASDQGYLADFWHHLARGRAMVHEGSLVDRDLFTFTVPGEPFIDVNWLSQLLYFGLFELGGLALVRIVNALVTAATCALLVELCRRQSGSLLYGCLVGAGVFLGLWQVLSIRPQTFSLLFFVGLLHVLERGRVNARWLWLAPPLMALWTNMHGAFPAGLLALFAYGAAGVIDLVLPVLARRAQVANEVSPARRAPWIVCFAASVAATLVNPYGWRIYAYVGNTSNRAATRGIEEWLPPSFDQAVGAAFFASLAIFAILVVIAHRRNIRLRAVDWCLLACFLPLACGSIRMAAWWLIALAPIVSYLLAALWPRLEATTPSLGAALTCLLLVTAAVFSMPGLREQNPLLAFKNQQEIERQLERLLVDLRRQQTSARVFSRLEWGEYFTWAAAPNYAVFMDGRIEIYPDRVWEEYRAVTEGRSHWQAILDAYQVDALVLDRTFHGRTGLLRRVEESPDWRLIGQDEDALMFLRVNESYCSRACP